MSKDEVKGNMDSQDGLEEKAVLDDLYVVQNLIPEVDLDSIELSPETVEKFRNILADS